MKVVHINAHGDYSTGRIARAIMQQKSLDSSFFYTRDDIDEEKSIKFYSNMGFKADLFLTRLFGMDSIWSFSNTRKMLRRLDEIKPDIIHLHNLHGFYINYIMLFKYIKKHNIKVVWTLHDCWSFTGHCAHFDYAGCDKWKSGCRKCPLYKQNYLKSWFFDNAFISYKLKERSFTGVKNMTIVTPSDWLAGLVKESFLNEYTIKTINNGINTSLFSPLPLNVYKSIWPKGKKVILAVSSAWGKLKGFDDIIELSKNISSDYALVVVGVNKAQKNILHQENIIAIEKTANLNQLAELYSNSDAFINLTYEENYPTVHLEALCCGCPIITYNTGGCGESLDKTNGIMVKKGDLSGVLRAINDLTEKKLEREVISQRSKIKFSYDNMVQKYLALYESI